MKGVQEIDCNEDIWRSLVEQVSVGPPGWGSFEHELKFAFKVENSEITEDEIEELLWDPFPMADEIVVEEVETDEEGRYFAAALTIWRTGIN